MPRSPLPFLLVTALLALATACSPTNWDTPYQTYLERLANTLDKRYAAPVTNLPARMPRPAILRHNFDTSRLDGLDFLALHGCELQLTIGKKNSSLGRMARDSQRLLLDLEFLQLAPGCIARLQEEGKEKLATTLQQAWTDKQQQLPRHIFNATLGGEEYRAFWQPRSPGLRYPGNTSSAAIEALGQINGMTKRWLGGDYRFDNRGFEILLSEVAMGDGGKLWHALAIQHDWLETANAVVARRLDEGPLCAEQFRLDAADTLPRVISRFFIDGIQHRAADMGRRYHQLLPAQHELEDLLSEALPAPYLEWRAQRDRQLSSLSAAPRRHVKQLQNLLEPCTEPSQ